MKNENIDIVLLWVDGNDIEWLKEKNKYLNLKVDVNINRYRDWNNLQYLFRGIDKYASWVHKIFFITWGHLPPWLNTNNEKLEIINHTDFIPSEYLPTFNSNVIEMNLHRINELSSRFILFNDDLFILQNLTPKDFFNSNLPMDMYIEYRKKNPSKRHIVLKNNYLGIINKYFNKKLFIKKNIFKIFNVKYGMQNFKTLRLLHDKNFNDLYSQHLTQSFIKETFNIVWKKEYYNLDKACHNRFRADNDIGYQLCRYWQILSGNFSPSKKLGKYFVMSNNNSKLISCIKKRKYKIICINDAHLNVDFEKAQAEVNNALDTIFPNKSTFEV